MNPRLSMDALAGLVRELDLEECEQLTRISNYVYDFTHPGQVDPEEINADLLYDDSLFLHYGKKTSQKKDKRED